MQFLQLIYKKLLLLILYNQLYETARNQTIPEEVLFFNRGNNFICSLLLDSYIGDSFRILRNWSHNPILGLCATAVFGNICYVSCLVLSKIQTRLQKA